MQKIVVASDVKNSEFYKNFSGYNGIKTVKNYNPFNCFLCKILYPKQKIFIKEVM